MEACDLGSLWRRTAECCAPHAVRHCCLAHTDARLKPSRLWRGWHQRPRRRDRVLVFLFRPFTTYINNMFVIFTSCVLPADEIINHLPRRFTHTGKNVLSSSLIFKISQNESFNYWKINKLVPLESSLGNFTKQLGPRRYCENSRRSKPWKPPWKLDCDRARPSKVTQVQEAAVASLWQKQGARASTPFSGA